MHINELGIDVLRAIKESLEHARDNRPGGLLYGEKTALKNVIDEIEKREAAQKQNPES